MSVSTGPPSPITQLLASASQGDSGAQNRLWATVYDELRQLAHSQLRAERAGTGLQTTLLVHEAYLRLVGDVPMDWNSRGHFFSAAANAMRRIRVDYARSRRSLKCGGNRRSVWLDEAPVVAAESKTDSAELLALDEALQRLERESPRSAQVVMLRYFAGLNIDEVASLLDLSARTIDLEWQFARTWLHRELSDGDTGIRQNVGD